MHTLGLITDQQPQKIKLWLAFKKTSQPFDFTNKDSGARCSERQRKHPAGLPIPPKSQKEKPLLLLQAVLNTFQPVSLLSVYLGSLPGYLLPLLTLGQVYLALRLKAKAEPHHNKVFPVQNLGVHNVIKYSATPQEGGCCWTGTDSYMTHHTSITGHWWRLSQPWHSDWNNFSLLLNTKYTLVFRA